MPTLHIAHPTQDFDTWKRAFDSDPSGRPRSGITRHSSPHFAAMPGPSLYSEM